jgi:hypothetical protein
MSEDFEFSQNYVTRQGDRKQLIRELLKDSVLTHPQISPGGGIENLHIISIPITHLIYNADNVRIRDKVLTEKQIENTDSSAFDREFFSKRENFETQKFIHEILSELAHQASADIYSRLKQTQSQRDPILIDTDGVIVDGNRRISSIRELYSENPSDFSKFETIECAVIPKANRQLNKEYEHQLHFADTLQLEYTWLNKALEAQRLEASGKDKREIKKQLQLVSLSAVDKLLLTAKGMQQYNRLKKGFDINHQDNNYVQLGDYGNEQAFLEIGKVMDKEILVKEKRQQSLLQSIVHFVKLEDTRAFTGRAFNLNQANKSHRLFDWFKKSIGVENTAEADKKLQELGSCKDFDELRVHVVELNDIRIREEKQQNEEEQQTQSKNKTIDALSALETINIDSRTTRKAHVRTIRSNLRKIQKAAVYIENDLDEKEDNLN